MTQDLPAGRTLGEFVVREKLGEGGFGAVYLAEQPRLGRDAVVKVLRTQLSGREDHAQRFLREARLLSRLDHPYAAHVYAFGDEPGGLLWIAMERVRGTALDELLRARGALTIERFVPLFERICDVVHTAHEQGIVHRDIKPANVMVISRAGRLLPKLLDFGIAKAGVVASAPRPGGDEPEWEDVADEGDDGGDGPAEESPSAATVSGEAKASPRLGTATSDAADGPTPREIVDSGATTAPVEAGTPALTDLTRAGTMMGSPPYIAPEQWRDAQTVDGRTDIYALGILAYECLTGRRPFLARTMRQMARAHARDPLPPLPDGFPPLLHAVLARATAKRPADRFADALAFAAALRSAAGLDDDEESIPRLEGSARDAARQDAPQPIAEALAALDSARSAHEARDALREVLSISARFLGLVAMAGRARVGSGGPPDVPGLAERLVTLRRRDLSVEEWVALARELCQPLVETPEAYPIPELIELLHGGTDPFALAFEESARGARAEVERLVPIVSRLLAALQPLWTYPLAVRRGDRVELWTGPRRARRAFAPAVAEEVLEGHPVLLDVDLARPTPRPPLSLWPLAQVAPPAAGAPVELFLLAGPGRHGALLVAPPHGFERHDPELWGWCREHLLPFVGETASGGGDDDDAPYAGLAPYTRARADRFFGREREIEELANRLRVASLGAVVGPSGAGKSSFVQAGLLPALPAGWQAITLRPGPSPMASLRAALQDAGWGALAAGGSLGELLGAHARAIGGTVVLVVDQLEELVTLCRDDQEREAFASALADAAGSPEQPVRVVVTLRDDFLIRVESLPPLRGRLTAGLALLGTPSSAELTRILVEPARRAGYELEDRALAAEIVQAVSGLPAALPLLSFTAARLWDLRDRQFRHLSRRAYEALGGVAGALAKHAEHTLADMLPEEQRLVREAFRHLVTADGTRAVLLRGDLVSLLGGPLAPAVVEKLVAARLCTTADDDRIELTHESLITAWPRLANWRREDQEGARLLGQLRAAARQWDERARPRGQLWLGDALAEYRLWRRRFPGSLTATEEAFAAASEAEDRRGRRFRRALVAASFLALVAVVVVLLRLNAQSRAAEVAAREREAEQLFEQGRQAVLAGDYGLALLYLEAAMDHGVDDPALRFLIAQAAAPFQHRLAAHRLPSLPTQLEIDRDGKRAVIGTEDGQVFTLDGLAPPVVLAKHDAPISAIAIDGDRVASGDTRGGLRLFPAAKITEGHTGKVNGLGFAPSGSLLASWSADHTLALWDRGDGRLVLRLPGHTASVNTAAWRADGGELASGSEDHSVRRWRFPGGESLVLESGDPDPVGFVTYLPDGGLVSAQGGDLRLWHADAAPIEMRAHVATIWRALASKDGARIVSVGFDKTAKLWEGRTGRLLASLEGHRGSLYDAAFDDRGSLLATAGEDGSILVWDVTRGKALGVLLGHGGQVVRLVWAAGSDRLLTASRDGSVAIWDVASLRHPEERGREVLDASFLDERRIAIARGDGATIWDLDGHVTEGFRASWSVPAAFAAARGLSAYVTGADTIEIWPDGGPPRVLAHFGGTVHALAVASDGLSVAAAGVGGAKWWTLDGALIAAFPQTVEATAIAIEPGRLATLSEDNRLRLFALGAEAPILERPSDAIRLTFRHAANELFLAKENGAEVLDIRSNAIRFQLLSAGGYVLDVESSHDGSLLATAATNEANLWDPRRGAPIARYLIHSNAVTTVAFSPDDRKLVTGGLDGALTIRPIARFTGTTADLATLVRCGAGLQLVDNAVRPAPPCD